MVLLFLDFSGGELLLIALVFLMFFGSKSLPDVARRLGKMMREIKEAANSVQRDIQESAGVNEIKEMFNQLPAVNQKSIDVGTGFTPVQPEDKKDNDGQMELPL